MNEYPANWKYIARRVKANALWRCVRCGHPHERPKHREACDDRCDPARHPGGLNDGRQRVLTVHHLDGDKANCAWWNLAPLCQVCHLHIQGKVHMERVWLFPHSEWFKPYVAGYYAHRFGLALDRPTVEANREPLIRLGQGRVTLDDLVTLTRPAPRCR